MPRPLVTFGDSAPLGGADDNSKSEWIAGMVSECLGAAALAAVASQVGIDPDRPSDRTRAVAIVQRVISCQMKSLLCRN